jgi:hypothetical protein
LTALVPKLRPILPLLLALAAVTALRDVAVGAEFTPLPEFPVCEASAIVGQACVTPGRASCVLIGDNEEKETLFEYTIGPSGLASPSRNWKRKLPDVALDIEALAPLGDEVVVVGSHGRKKDCTRDEKRLRLLRVRSAPGGSFASVAKIQLDDSKRWSERLRDCAKELIRLPDGASAEEVAMRDGVCRAIAEAETAAGEEARPKTDVEGRAKCAETFNVEGAVVLPGEKGDRLWLGLRAPLFEKRAILLRVADVASSDEGVRFDGVATIDLGGLGIRELTANGEWIYGTAGSMQDGDTSTFWRAVASDLRSGTGITAVGTLVGDLPGGAEGLFVQTPAAARALIVIDGEKNGASCKEPSRQVVVGVPIFQRLPR